MSSFYNPSQTCQGALLGKELVVYLGPLRWETLWARGQEMAQP